MALIQIKTVSKVVPQCYAYTTPGVPAHDGWTKIGFTERDVETRINEQTHTVGVAIRLGGLCGQLYDGTLRNLYRQGLSRYLKNWESFVKRIRNGFKLSQMPPVGIFIDFTQNHGVVVG